MSSVSLESLQFLLPHMDANRRFEISTRCPALRAIEKSIPLKIDRLVLDQTCVIVNDNTYKLGIIRKYNVGEAPEYVRANNEIGGLLHEVDRYGIKDWLDEYTVTPGDVELYRQRGEPWIPTDDSTIRSLENQIQRYEVRLAQERERALNRHNSFIHYRETAIEVARAKLLDFHGRRENIPPIFEHFLQLTTSRTVDKEEQKTVERYNHNKKYSEAVKQLTTVLLGGRSSFINVTKMKLISRVGVIRLPIGVNFRVEQLTFNGGATELEALAPILHASSFPLKKLAISGFSLDELDNPTLRAAGILKIGVFLTEIPQVLSSATNPIVHIRIVSRTEQNLEELIPFWVESERSAGTEFIFDLGRRAHFTDEMEDILKRLHGVPIDDENVIISMSDTSNLKVSYGPFPEFAPRSQWAVRFSTVAIEH